MRLLIVILTLIILIPSCNKNPELTSQPRTNLTFDELPDTVKYYYIKSTVNDVKDESNKMICINPNIQNCEYEIKWFASFVDEYIFQIDSRTFKMEFNGNTINKPYIVYKNHFYFLITRNTYNIESIKKAKYGKFDLTEILTKRTNKNGG